MHLPQLSWLICLVLLLTGCTTHHTPGVADYKPINAAQLLTPIQPPSNVQNASTVIVKRDNGLAGSALAAEFFVDGTATARLSAGDYFKFEIEPGEHIFGVKSSKKGFILPAKVFREITVDCRPSRSYTLRLYPDFEEGIQIQRSSY